MAIPSGSTLFWHRRDLRLEDNVGLHAAADTAPVVPVYCLDPALLSLAGSRRRRFFRSALTDLQRRYRERGSDLLVRQGDPDVVVPTLAAESGADRVVWNQDHSKYARERDRAIIDELEDANVTVVEAQDMTLHEPGSILTSNGDHYSVFSPYYTKWAAREADAPASSPDSTALAEFSGPELDTILDVERDGPLKPLRAGREAALSRLESFLQEPVFEYAEKRNDPAASGTSRLSQDLKFGLLGIREVIDQVADARERADSESARESVEAFHRQLAWRDFYVQVLAASPETVWENFKDFERAIDWRTDPEGLEAWKRGETGYPFVDAGMRQLLETGFVHNRVRMVVASFLTKDLQIDWRDGYRWFRERLVDHDTASDVGGWQWAASTGTDPQPYFRVFNPTTQGERYDPEAEYIKSYVPELADVQPADVHAWPTLDQDRRRSLAPDYRDPIVDHAERRKSAIEMFERARGN